MGGKLRRVIRAEEVPQIFQMKANGKSNVDIAEAMSVSDSHISMILHRKTFADVEVPQHLLDAVKGMLIHRKPRSEKSKGKGKAEPSFEAQAHATNMLTNACFALLKAEEACVAAGMDKERVQQHIMFLTNDKHL